MHERMKPEPSPTSSGKPEERKTPRGPQSRDWLAYFEKVDGKPREATLRALEAFEREGLAKRDKRALDLGSGEGRDARAMLDRGWSVVSVDPHADALRLQREKLVTEHAGRLTLVQAELERLAAESANPLMPAGGFALVNASFSLPFVEPEQFASVWAWLVGRLAPRGRFSGQFFGERDSWTKIPGRSHHTRSEVERFLAPFEVELFREDEKDGFDVLGDPKHWHVFHVVARLR